MTSFITTQVEAGEALTPYSAVIMSSATAINADAVTERVFGIVYENQTAADGDDVTIVVGGKYLCRVDGSGTAIAVGDQLTPSSTDGVLVTNAGTSTHQPCAIALEATDEAAVIEVLLTPGAQPNA